MELVAYVNGDVTTLTQILSQIAMALGGGTFMVAAKACAIIGIIIALFGGMLRGGQISPSTFMWPILISVLMLLPRVDLVIEDTKGGVSRVDDLPIGFAGPVSIITHLGLGASNLMTDYLGLDDYAITMDNGHLVSLRAPIVFSQVITQEEFQGPASTFHNGLSPTKDVSAYVSTCLQWRAKVPGSDVRLPMLRNLSIAELRVEDGPRTVATSDGRSFECGTLFDELMRGFANLEYQTRLNEAINIAFGKYEGDTTTGARYQAALAAVIDNPIEFYRAAAFSHALQMISGDITQAAGGASQQAALNDALAQKREKNFGAAAMIFETIGHTIEFIEVWSFSLFPLALLVLMLGAIGARMAVKYLWMLVWVQLWYPTLLIVMDYLDVKLKTVAISSTSTIANYGSFMLEVLRLQDVGYVHLSMATALSMGLVFGSSAILASNIQRDLTGSSHYDPKKNAPDTLSRNALTAFHSPFSYSPNQGYVGHSAQQSFAGAQFTFDRKLSEGTNWAETAQFARTGQRGTTSTLSNTSTVTAGYSATNMSAATTDWSAAATSGKEVESATSADWSSRIGDTHGEGLISQNRKSTVIGGNANVGGQVGVNVLGTGGGVSGGLSYGTSIDNSLSDSESNEQSAATSIGANERVGTRTSAGTQLRYGKGEQETDTIGSRQDKSKTAQKGETVTDGVSTTRSDSQSEGESGSEMVSQQASVKYDGILAANRIAADHVLMDHLSQTVMNTGIANEVDAFMAKNQDKLDGTFAGPDGDDAKYAFSAMYVMQGLTGNPYAGQENSQERMDVLNALGDEILWQSGFSSAHPRGDAPSMDELRNSNPVDPNSIDNAYTRLSSGFDLTEDLVDDALARLPANGDPQKAVDELFGLIGADAEEITEGQGNAILQKGRERIDREFGPIREDAVSFIDTRRELGFKAAVQDLYRDNQAIRDSDVYGTYKATKDEGWFTDGKNASEMMDARMSELNAQGIASPDNDLARFMVATQLYAGAVNAGDDAMANEFQSARQEVLDRNPGFSAGDTEERLTAIAMLGTSANVMRESMLRGQQEAQLGALEYGMEQATSFNLDPNSEKVSWKGQGGSSVDPGSFVGELLGFIRSVEAPNGYSDYYRGSRIAPEKPLETMTINEVRAWQSATLNEQKSRGIPFEKRSSAAGAYQIISGTLDDLVRDMGLTGNERFDAEMQDRMALRLLEGRGLSSYQSGHISLEQFGNNVAKEWASMPMLSGVNEGKSAHAGVGSNRALKNTDEYREILSRA